MKGYYEGPGVGSVIFMTIFVAGLIGALASFGNISISLTGQPQIDSLSNQLVECHTQLDEKCSPCPEVQCQESNWLTTPFTFLFGIVVGFLYSMFFGEDTKKVLAKRLLKEVKKNERD